jgi:DNA-binding MarR family transcriptional regulator
VNREDSLGYVINQVARQFARALHDEISQHGVVPGQFAQLLALYERDGITQQELCEIVQIEQPTMANTLKRMERDGLVERVPHSSDRRKHLIVLTDKAKRLEGSLIDAANRVNATATQGLDRKDAGKLMATMRLLASNLDKRSL